MGIQHQAGSDSIVTAKLFFKLKEALFQNRLDTKYHNALYGFNNEIEYDPYNDSPDEEPQTYFYGNSSTPGLENYTEGTTNNAGAGMYYGSGYYRATSPYSMGGYYMSPGYSQGMGVNQNAYTMYTNETINALNQ